MLLSWVYLIFLAFIEKKMKTIHQNGMLGTMPFMNNLTHADDFLIRYIKIAWDFFICLIICGWILPFHYDKIDKTEGNQCSIDAAHLWQRPRSCSSELAGKSTEVRKDLPGLLDSNDCWWQDTSNDLLINYGCYHGHSTVQQIMSGKKENDISQE